MTANRLTALSGLLLVGTAVLAGCQPPPPPPTVVVPVVPPPPTTADRVAAYRAMVEKVKPGSIVGLVVATQSESNLAAVGDLPVQDFKVGQTVSFVDIDGNVINHGFVKNVTNEFLVVQYDTQGKRRTGEGRSRLVVEGVDVRRRVAR